MSTQNNFKNLSSGLKEIIAEEESQKRFNYLFTLLINNKRAELDQFFLEKAHLLDTMQLKAFRLYSKLVFREKVKAQDISITEIKPFIANALAKEIALIHKSQAKFTDLNFDELNKLLPKLKEYLETEITQKASFKPNYKLNLIDTNTSFDSKNYKEKLDNVYKEISEIQNQAAKISKIDKETCFKANCCDCCVYTPPLVTKLEFEYIKANVNIEQAKKNAQKNQLLHKVEFGTVLGIIDLDNETKEAMNPNNFAHRCPFLADDNACTIHEHRPFACRFYGLSSLDGQSVQACNYYLEQFDPEERTVLDSRTSTQILGKANKEICDGLQLAGTLTAWLSSSCKE
jgi:Fe-S-cluster containining protein